MSEKQVPFFSRFLESQEYPQVQSDVKAGPGGGGGGTLPHRDNLVTMKYPSDDDEGGPTI